MSFSLDRISFGYNGKRVFDSFSASFPSNGFCGILGPNGSGKTTLLDLMARHLKPWSGEIRLMGESLSRYPRRRLARKIALVPQDYGIRFPFTVAETVLMGRYPHMPRFSAPSAQDWERVEGVMERTGIKAYGSRRVTELSSGERQRVIFGRALAQDAEVLLLDEATAHLDIEHALSLLKIAADEVKTKGKTVIAVFHDINLAAAFCDTLFFIKDGRVAAEGPIETVLTPETIRAVYQVEAKVEYSDFSAARQVVFKSKGIR